MLVLKVANSVEAARDPGVVWELHLPAEALDGEELPILPRTVKVLHVGDLRSPQVGDVTPLLERRIQQLGKLVWRHYGLRGVVVHAESALGWKAGEIVARCEFWGKLHSLFTSHLQTPVLVENNVVHNPAPRYYFINDPYLLVSELSWEHLQLALDTSHAAWFYSLQGRTVAMLTQFLERFQQQVGHLHLSDWMSSAIKPAGQQHLSLGSGVLPIRRLLSVYRGDMLTLEVSPEAFLGSRSLLREMGIQ